MMHLRVKPNKIVEKENNLFLNCPYGFKNKDINVFNCINCKDAKCLTVCKNQAIYFSAKGIISIDQKKCNGCEKCQKACPHEAIVIKDGKAYKCDLCSESSFAMYCYENNKDILELVGEDIKENEAVYNKYLGYKITESKIKRELSSSKKVVETDVGKRYIIEHPILSEDEIEIINSMLNNYNKKSTSENESKTSEAILSDLESELIDYCYLNNIELDRDQFSYILKTAFDNLYNYGPLTTLLSDDELEEIAVIGIDVPVYVYHRHFGWLETNIVYVSLDALKDIINKLAWHSNKYITLKNPLLDASLKDNSRMNAVINPISETAVITIRKFLEKPFTVKDLLEFGTISLDALAFLSLVFLTDSNVFVVGNTGSGKTTTLNALLSFVPSFERFVIVEEVREINTIHKHKINLLVNSELGVTMESLVINTLRMRPDRVVIGEVRSKDEARAIIDSMLCGQAKGTYTTFHAQTANEVLLRLQSYGVMACDLGVIDLIVTQRRYNRYTAGKASDHRNIMEISEVIFEDNQLKLNQLYVFDDRKGVLVKKNTPRKILGKLGTAFDVHNIKEFDALLARQKKRLSSLIEKSYFDSNQLLLLFSGNDSFGKKIKSKYKEV